tara:strand:- start:1048 stop:2379 length:1332 start_codon:yes stop_codon:yes gene_type:complete
MIAGILPVSAAEPFAIHIVDETTGRPVPLVELETVNHLRFVTDNAGIIAFDEPGLMDMDVFFHVRSHGYEFPKDGFGFSGRRLQTISGGVEKLEIKRINIAERLYRLTGAGLYAESARLEAVAPIAKPLLNSGVFGSDSVHNAIYQGELFWLWGDTNRPGYPLGNFQVTCAQSTRPGEGNFDPDVGIDLRYFEGEDGFTRKMAPISGKGPTWLGGLLTLPDRNGKEHLVAKYVKVKPPLTVYEKGLCEYFPEKGIFERILVFDEIDSLAPNGHPFVHQVKGKEWVYFGQGVPTMRVPANYESWKDPSQYEAIVVDVAFVDATTGEAIKNHNGSVQWNPWRKKWISIFTQSEGESSYLGEIWYAEADTPEGPWRKAVKILTHDQYSFYNPKQHPYFSKEGGRVIYFEGTYTATFSNAPVKTPRYDYNQILYRLDLDDERLQIAR